MVMTQTRPSSVKLTSLCHIAIKVEAEKLRLVPRSVTTARNSAMSGLTASNLPLYVVWGRSPAQGVFEKEHCSIDTDVFQLEVGGRRGISSLQLVDAEATPETRTPKTTSGRVFSSNHTIPGLSFAAALHTNTSKHQQPHPSPLCTDVVPLRHNQQEVPNLSVQNPNVNSSSMNDIFIVVATVFEHVMAEFNGVESEEDRIMDITKYTLKLMKRKGTGIDK
jgi:hypothetical protein